MPKLSHPLDRMVDNPELDPELLLCVAILAQAVADYELATSRPDWRPAWNTYPAPAEPAFNRRPLAEVQAFFSSSWFNLICAGLGLDPAEVVSRLRITT